MEQDNKPQQHHSEQEVHVHDHNHDHAHEHDHDHPHDHAHGHDHGHEHAHSDNAVLHWLQHLFAPHAHDHQQAALDPNLATERGIWAVKMSLAALLTTAFFQVIVVAISGSVALLADTIHNFSDALTAIPLGLAFWLSRRASNQRYTYGYGRAEDIAGAIIVAMIAFSAFEAIRQALLRFIEPMPIQNLGWVAAAALIGFAGNELVAIFRIRVGQEIGSAALIADGYHARTDGFTSLAVLAGAIGVWLGFPLLDPIIGLIIGVTILGIVWKSAKEMVGRIMDAVEPQVTQLVTDTAAAVADVMDVHDVAIRWVGHRQRAEMHITVDCELPTHKSHHIAEEVRHALFHALPALVEITVHVDPCECARTHDHHHHTAHHRFLPVAG
jgi:cation diffusion facilitator family transporter